MMNNIWVYTVICWSDGKELYHGYSMMKTAEALDPGTVWARHVNADKSREAARVRAAKQRSLASGS